MKPLYWLFAWFIAAIGLKKLTDKARETDWLYVRDMLRAFFRGAK